ncbi:MAG: ParB/RepB/Spo0J family partition protein [Acidobacteriota bacterium]
MNKRVLGKGLDALFAGAEGGSKPGNVAIDEIVVRADQPRRVFEEAALKELSESIKEHGILQPLLVRPIEANKYELIAGERRLRAAKIAGLAEVPVFIRELDDRIAREAALIENLQREDLSPVEEATAYKEMIEGYDYTQEELSERIGKSRSYVANTIRLLNLPKEVLQAVNEGQLTAGHARAILSLKGTEEQVKLANRIISSGMSVRESEGAGKKVKQSKKDSMDIHIKDIEDKLQDALGTRVQINRKKKGGNITVAYFDDEDLERLMELMGVKP